MCQFIFYSTLVTSFISFLNHPILPGVCLLKRFSWAQCFNRLSARDGCKEGLW